MEEMMGVGGDGLVDPRKEKKSGDGLVWGFLE